MEAMRKRISCEVHEEAFRLFDVSEGENVEYAEFMNILGISRLGAL